jgi:hypothetical protein
MSEFQQFFGGAFNTSSVPPADPFDALPPGNYYVTVEKAEVKATKAGNGHYIKLQLSVLDAQYKNRKLFDNINIDNPNKDCVEIGLRQLASLGIALGMGSIADTDQLLGYHCIAKVAVKDGANVVKAYSAIEQQAPVQQPVYVAPMQQPVYQAPVPQPAFQNAAAPIQQPSAPAGNKPPWARG